MKASIKFRDDQKPLLRAKVPINVLSFPFQSSVVAGETKDLSLNLTTNFDFGPCFKFSYKPNNVQNPFAFVCKTGIGHYGSPNSSPFVMSAEFNLVGSQNPRFWVHFKPQIGDFLAKKYCSSVELGGSKGFGDGVGVKNGYFAEGGKIGGFSVEPAAVNAVAAAGVGVVGRLLSGMEMSARTVLPIGKRVGLNFKWGVRVPGEGDGTGSDMVLVGRKGDWATGINGFRKFCPVLVMNKIGVEQVVRDDAKERGLGLEGNESVAEVCLNMKKQLEVMQAENGLLSKALDDLRSDIAAGKMMSLSFNNGSGEMGRNGWKPSGGGRADGRSSADKKSSGSNAYVGKGCEENRHEEMKKALMGAPGA